MSLVGTRPPTVDEWEKYELHHRVDEILMRLVIFIHRVVILNGGVLL